MNLQNLSYFAKVAKYEHIAKASEELYITPSALSRAINNLEDEIGVKLFEKDGRNIKLNQYGKLFYTYVQQALNNVEEGITHIQELTNTYTGTVRVSSIFSVGATYIPQLIKDFQKNYGTVKLELTQKTTRQILNDLVDYIEDIGFCGEFDEEEFPTINKEFIYNENMSLIVPANHRLADKKEVVFNDIKDEVFIGYNNSTGIINTIYNEVSRIGYPNFRFKTAFKSNDDTSVAGLVRAGLGIAFIVEAYSDGPGVVSLKLKDLHFRRSIYAVWNKKSFLTSATKLFRKFAISQNRYI